MATTLLRIITYITVFISTSSDSARDGNRYDNSSHDFDSITTMTSVLSDKSEILNQARNISLSQTTVSHSTQNYLNDEPHEYQSGNIDNEYDYSDSKFFDSSLCQKTWNCDYTKDWLDPPYLCFCDDMCTVYKDCCQNAKVRSDGNSTVVNASFDCKHIPSINDHWFVYIVNTCPEDTTYDLHRLCIEPTERNIYSTTPVTSFTTGFLYRNVYCALCNGETDYVFWKVVLRCVWDPKDNSKFIGLSIQELYMRDECYLLYKEPIASSYRKCYPKITQCPEPSNTATTKNDQTGNDVTRCKDGGNRYVFTPDVIYKNPACYQCNKENDTSYSDATCNILVFEEKHFNVIYNPRIFIHNLNAILDVPSQQLTVTRYHTETTVDQSSFAGLCEPSEAYDPFNGGCKNVCYGNNTYCSRSLFRTLDASLEYTAYEYQYVVDYNEFYWDNDYNYEDDPDYYGEDYFAVYEYTKFTSEDCQKKYKCKAPGDRSSVEHYCFCNKKCLIYKDCCENSKFSFEGNTNDVKLFDCIYMPRIYDKWFVFVVNSCPEGTDFELRRLCEETDEQNIYSSTPVSALDTKFLYRNMYCAMCNGSFFGKHDFNAVGVLDRLPD